MRDGSEAIRAGAAEALGDEVPQAMCYAHVKRNYQKYAEYCALPKEIKEEIDDDIDTLQIVWSDKHFTVGKELFMSKWLSHNDARITAFVRAVESEYFRNKTLSTWYEGYTSGPSNNNGNESFNRLIKEAQHRTRVSVRQLITNFNTNLNKWSRARNLRNINVRPFSSMANVTAKVQLNAFKWTESKPLKEKSGKGYVIASACYTMDDDYEETEEDRQLQPGDLPEDFCIQNEAVRWKALEKDKNFLSFEELRKHVKMFHFCWRESSNGPPEYRWSCTCRWFLKRHICCHSLGMAVLKDDYVIDKKIIRRHIKLQKKRGPGRPKKTEKALKRQLPDIGPLENKRRAKFCQCKKPCGGGRAGKPCSCYADGRTCSSFCKCVCEKD